jgi:hypothetical protein
MTYNVVDGVNEMETLSALIIGYSTKEDQRKAAFIVLQHMHGYWKIDAHHHIQRK